MSNIQKTKDIFSLSPSNLQEAMQYADLIAQSSMVPKAFQNRPSDVLVAVQMGAELGLPPTQALQNIAVINGRPSLWGDAVLAVCKGSSLCEYVRERWDDQNKTATCIAKRRGDDEEVVRTFSFDDAKRAGLLGKQGPWSQYPKRMAAMRARSWAVRDAFPDLLKGISVYEEQMDIIEKDVTPNNNQDGSSRSDQIMGLISNEENQDDIDNVDLDQSKQSSIDLDNIVNAIKASCSIEDLKEVIEHASNLPDDLKNKAREEYMKRINEIKKQRDNNE